MDVLEDITIDGKRYSYVKTRTYVPVSVYRGQDEFLRIGPKDIITKGLNLHKKLLEFNFPIPQILSEGEFDGQCYYTETSLGKSILGDVFWNDTKKSGVVSDESFQKLLVLVGKYVQAQLKTAKKEEAFESFYFGIHMEYLLEELPHLQKKIMAGFEKLKAKTNVLPTVMTHGDFNPYNIFEIGVIDFEGVFDAPAGYDIVSNAYHTFLFPKGGDFESTRRYDFSADQIDRYFALVDALYIENNLPKLSDFSADFIFARTIWSTVRMQKLPKIQRWRYEKFEEILESYLSDNGDVIKALIK